MSNDVYKDVMKEVFTEAPAEVVAGFKKKMAFIQDRYSHSKKTVESCLQGLSEKPTLVELLAAAYLVNGGVVFKYSEILSGDDLDGDSEYTRLLQEMDELNCTQNKNENLIDDILFDNDIPTSSQATSVPSAATHGSSSSTNGSSLS